MSNISASSDYKLMKFHSLEPPYQGASNGGIYKSLVLTDEKLFAFFCLETF